MHFTRLVVFIIQYYGSTVWLESLSSFVDCGIINFNGGATKFVSQNHKMAHKRIQQRPEI